MICYTCKMYCCEDPSLIENYELAVNDKTKTWDCHHRNEILMNKTKQELIDLGLYYNRPANELIFLDPTEHNKLHNIGANNPRFGKEVSQEQRDKQSNSMSGKYKGNNNPAYKWQCPLPVIYMYNVLGYKKSTICKALNIGNTVLNRIFKENNIKKRYNRI